MARNRSRRPRRAPENLVPAISTPVSQARPTVATRMDAKALLGRQMASIADTLAKASLRRNVEVKKRSVHLSPFIAPVAEPSVTSSSGLSGVVVFAGRRTKPDANASRFGRFNIEQQGANNIMDQSASRVTPRGDDGDDDCAGNEGTHSQNNVDAIHTNRPEPVADSHETDDSQAILAHLEHVRRTDGTHAADSSDDFDLKRMLAEFDKNPIRSEDEDADFQEPLRGSQDQKPSTRAVAVHSTQDGVYNSVLDATEETSNTDYNDPRRMLTEIEDLCNNDPKKMPAELERMSSVMENDGDDLATLRAGLTNWLSPSDDQELPTIEDLYVKLSNNQDEIESVCPKELVPYVIALELEMSGQEWEKGLLWTEYLFGSDLNSHKAEQEKAAVVAQTEKDLHELIEYTLHEEEKYQQAETERRLPCRVVVSNIATAVDIGDLKVFFYGFRNFIQDIKILPGRDPIKGIQMAHIDCYSREAATQVSFMYGHIFGLTLDIQLAIPRGEDESY